MSVLAIRGRTKSSGGLTTGRPSFLWSLPTITYFSLFAIVPLVVVAWLSFTQWDLLGSPRWIGTQNWSQVFSDPIFLHGFKVMIILTALGVVTQTPFSLMIGVWAAGRQSNRALLAGLYFLPLLMSTLAIAVVWGSLLDSSYGLPGELGFFRSAIFNHGYLFSKQSSAIGVLTFVGIWQWTPLHTLIYQGAARAIPEVLYQAAAIDGAGRVRQFLHITLPQLRNTVVTSVVLMIVGGMTTFDSILVLTNGGPDNGTTSTAFYMYKSAFNAFRIGPASVMAVVLVVFATILSLITVRVSGWSKMRSTQEGV